MQTHISLPQTSNINQFSKDLKKNSSTMSRTISIGLAGKNLKDRDFFGVSDPYCTISRPEPSGGFRKIRTSETKMNTLNPSWNDFLFNEDELNGADKELKLM